MYHELVIRENIALDAALVLAADDAGKVVGLPLATACMNPPVFDERRFGPLNDMAVTADYRRRGTGEQTVAVAIDWFRGKELLRLREKWGSKPTSKPRPRLSSFV